MDELELIKQKINIVDLISEYLPLKKAGVNFKTNCPFHHEKTPSFVVSPERGIWHCFGCFPPGELIKTPFGYHTIEDIETSDWVVSGKGNLKKVIDVMEHQYNGDLITVGVRKLGGLVRLTADHRVFVISGSPYINKYKVFSRVYKKYLDIRQNNSLKYFEKVNKYLSINKIPAGELKIGDLLLYPINRQISNPEYLKLDDYLTKKTSLGTKPKALPEKIIVNQSFLKLLGYYIAEGSNHRAYIRFSLGNHEEAFAEEIIKLIKELFNLEAKLYRRVAIKKTGIEITVCNSHLANIFENLCGKGSKNKHIPFILQELDPRRQRMILEAVIKGDGTHFFANKSKNQFSSVTTISKVLKEQIVDILLRLNLFPTVSVHKERVSLSGTHHQESYYISWTEQDKQKYQHLYYEQDGSEYWLLPITKLASEKYQGPVHNFTVADDHSYVATNFAVGNCDKGGDIFKFMMEKESLSFQEAIEILAKKAGVTLSNTKRKKVNENDKLYEVNQKAAQFFHYLLMEHKIGEGAMEYLKKRGLTEETIKTFQIGYAPQNWETLTKFLRSRGFSTKDLINSGLAVPSKRGCYDRFRGRVMFPLIDIRDRVIGFSGRILGVGEPKYINTPQTPIFDKRKFLLGLNLTKGEIREKKEAVLVEGEMDMIMSYQSGIKNVVASKGTALAEEQIESLKKYTDTISLCFDTDLAGDAASRRGIEMADKAGMNIKVINFAGVKDPAELVASEPGKWETMVKQAEPIYDYYLQSVIKRFDPKLASSKKSISQELFPIWKKISDPLVKEHYIQKLSALLQIKDNILREQIEKYQLSPNVKIFNPVSPNTVTVNPGIKAETDNIEIKNRRRLLEEYLITLILHIPTDHTFVPNFPETLFTQEEFKQIYVLQVIFLDGISFKGQSFRIADFIKTVPDNLVDLVDQLYLTQLDKRLEEKKYWQKEIEMVVMELKKMLIKTSLEKLSFQIKAAQEFEKQEQLEILNKRFRDLSLKLKNL